MKVHIKGSSTSVDLTKSNYLAGGGEGNCYVIGDTAYKIYHDPKKMIPEGKIAELSAISDPSVIRPQGVLCDPKGNLLGYTMKFVSDTLVLCQLFPRSFREREGLEHSKVLSLVRTMQENVTNVHKSGVLIVDLNEMNVLTSKDFSKAYWIDVDSYQTAHYPATAIMPSVQDPLVVHNDFTEMSDWFSFGVLAFQMFIGIHPYKGKHPVVKTMEDRMRAGISVFDPAVSVPKVCYHTDVIPEAYRSWFKAVFQDRQRVAPPTSLQVMAPTTQPIRTILSSGNLIVTKLRSYDTAIRRYFHHGNSATDVVQLSDARVMVGPADVFQTHEPIEVGYTPVGQRPVIMCIERHTRQGVMWAEGQELSWVTRADEISSCNGRIYIRNRDRVLEAIFTETQHADGTPNIIASARETATVMERASQLFPGGVLQNMLGSVFVSLFPRTKASYQIRVPELDGVKVVEAKFDGGVLMTIVAKRGKYGRFIFRFAEDYSGYDVRSVDDITPAGLNFVTLDSGVCVCLTEEENLEVFSAKKGSASVKVVEDKILGGDLRLVKVNGHLGFTRGDTVFSLHMK